MPKTIKEIQELLKKGHEMMKYESDELSYITKPIGRAIYENSLEERKENIVKVNRYEKIKCDLCGKTVSKANKSHHNKTQYHQAFEKMNNKLKKILLDG